MQSIDCWCDLCGWTQWYFNAIRCETTLLSENILWYGRSGVSYIYNLSGKNYIIQHAEGQNYKIQYRFILQTGLWTGELVGLKWEDVAFKSKTIQIRRSMEYRYSAKEWRIGELRSRYGYRYDTLNRRSGCYTEKTKRKE